MSELTQRTSGKALLVAVAALMIAALAFFGPPSKAEVPVTTDGGIILLSTGPDASDNWVRYYENADPDTGALGSYVEQAITLNRCKVTTDGSILSITQDGGSKGLGLVSNGFGTRDKNNCATGNGQVGVGDSVTIGLGSTFTDGETIDLAEIDIEGKQNADLEYTVDGGTPVTVPLNSSSSDNGPDSGPNDNEIVTITGSFSSVTLTPTGNSKALISVEGGGDGTPYDSGERSDFSVHQSLFSVSTTEIYNGEIDCGEGAEAIDASSGTGPAVDGSLDRGTNLKTPSDCTLVPYTFEIQDDAVFFDFLDTDAQGARFLVQIVWNPGIDPINPPVRQVDYYKDGTDGFTTGLACVSSNAPSGAQPDIQYDYVHPVSNGNVPDGLGGYIASGEDVPVCLAGQELVLTTDGWQQIQYWDVTGDPKWL